MQTTVRLFTGELAEDELNEQPKNKILFTVQGINGELL